MDLRQEDSIQNLTKYLTFMTNDQIFGISIYKIVQIIGMQDITYIPEFPSYIKGVINVREDIIPVIDIRARFMMDEKSYDERTCIIIVRVNDKLIGLIVDEVRSVVDIDKDKITTSYFSDIDIQDSYLEGVSKLDENVILLINVDHIFISEELQEIPLSITEQE